MKYQRSPSLSWCESHHLRLWALEPLERRELLSFTDGNALTLDGVDDFAAEDTATLDLGTENSFTIEASFRLDEDAVPGRSQTILYKDGAYALFLVPNRFGPDTLEFRFFTDPRPPFQPFLDLAAPANVGPDWHHVAAADRFNLPLRRGHHRYSSTQLLHPDWMD